MAQFEIKVRTPTFNKQRSYLAFTGRNASPREGKQCQEGNSCHASWVPLQSCGDEKVEAGQARIGKDPRRFVCYDYKPTTLTNETFVVGLDIFTGKKHDEILRDEAQVVVNDKVELLLLNIEGSALSVLTDSGDTRGDLNLPNDELGEKIREKFDEGLQLNLTILRALGREQIVGWAEDKS